MPEQGWYEDPQGGGGQRWWDGQRWTEHTTPPPTNVPPPPVGGAPVAPPQADPGMVGTGAPTAGGYGTAGTPGAGYTPAAAAGASGAKGGAGKLIAIIVGLLLLAGVAVVVVLLLTGDGDGDDAELGTLRAGDSRQFEVPQGGEWTVTIEAPAGLLVIDARGLDGFDPVAELRDEGGRQLDRNDDRSFAQQEEYGGGGLDSLIEIEVPAGTYRVVITGFASEGGSGIVSFPIVGG